MADKQTLQQFGASIKAKHPEYKDMDDVGVGKAVLAKYPQYNDMVEQTPTSTDPSGRTPTGEPAVGDTRNGVQRYLDNLITPDPRREEFQSPIRSGVDDFAQHVASSVVPLISHPIDSAMGMGKQIGHAIASNPGSATGAMSDLARPLIEHAVGDYQAHGPVRGTTDLLGTGAGMAASGELTGAATAPIVRGASSLIAPVAEDAGLWLGNAALGARGPKPFKYGANPARGAFEEGALPALSRGRAAQSVDNLLPEVGQRISDKVMGGGTAPLSDIANSIESPVNEARGIIEGPGGGNRSFEPVEALRSSMERRAPGASAPIYGPGSGTPFTADEAASAITRPGRLALPAPSEDIPLGETPYHAGRLSEPIRLNQPYDPEQPITSTSIRNSPFEIGPQWDNPGALKPNEYVGERPGTFGGGQPPGVLRRPMQFPESAEQSPLLDLRHPTATAPDLWRTIQNIDKNTRFNPDPEVEGVNELRRDIRGGLRGNLEDAVPGLKPLSQRYGDLKSAEDVLGRSMYGGTNLNKLLSVPMTPVESTLGAGLYGAGKVLRRIGAPSDYTPLVPLFPQQQERQ